MAAIAIQDFLERGREYTFSLSSSNLAYFTGGAFNAQAMDVALSSLSSISKAQAWSPATFSGAVNVTFTYIGDGSDAVGAMANNIIDALDSTLTFGSFDFMGATDNRTGIGVDKPNLPSIASLNIGLVSVAVIALLVVFVMSGGPGVARRVSA